MSDRFEVARLETYLKWLRRYFILGGSFTHYYDYPWERAGFLEARRSFILDGEARSLARPILVMDGVGCKGPIGHNHLYYLNSSATHRGNIDWIPAYINPEFDNLPGVDDLKERAAAERRAVKALEGRREIREESSPSDLLKFLRRDR